ncbi:MAG TPA: hypothetical protein VGQ65_07555 [Thermoanaerobaculia bacterium]|nr:hypothetical protein [Thermoanaerobaculia bacterium]
MKPETRNQKPEMAPAMKPETRAMKPETRNQKPEMAPLRPHFWFLVSDF